MADYHLSVKAVSRAAGRSATAAAAYRAGCMIEDERTGTVHDYRRKQGVETAFIILPPVAPAGLHDRAALWNAAEAAEKRRDAKVAREWEVGLPRELSKEGRERAGREYAQWIVDRHGIAVDAALHAPSRRTGNDNWHMHLLGSTRIVGAQGFGAKTRDLDRKQTAGPLIEEARAKWAEIANQALEREGYAARIDHRSLKARGIDRQPTIHEGPAVREMEARGLKTGIGDQNREIRADNGNKAEIALLESGIKTLDAYIERLTRLQATARLPAVAVPKPAGTPPEAPEAERGAILAPEPQPAPTAARAAQRVVPDKIGRAQRVGRGSPMQYRGKPQAHTAGFRFPAWTMPAPARGERPEFAADTAARAGSEGKRRRHTVRQQALSGQRQHHGTDAGRYSRRAGGAGELFPGAAWHPPSGGFEGRTGSEEGKKAAGAARAGGTAESGTAKGQRARRQSGQAPA
jgi:MobA/MobL family